MDGRNGHLARPLQRQSARSAPVAGFFALPRGTPRIVTGTAPVYAYDAFVCYAPADRRDVEEDVIGPLRKAVLRDYEEDSRLFECLKMLPYADLSRDREGALAKLNTMLRSDG
jgi:hypothetical protein